MQVCDILGYFDKLFQGPGKGGIPDNTGNDGHFTIC